ncbi:circadian clock protein KaiC [Gemmata sp.]|uniref:circadian clock protein KaiC n=1 Tax=Gemmata sp. TaxID=1914242 RepID=UPI003F70B511
MNAVETKRDRGLAGLPKCPTGIPGLDEVTGGGLPRGRPTLVCGGPGCGKTVLAVEFLVRGATRYDEPGVLMAFEETAEELAANVRSLGFDLGDLVARKKLAVDYVYVEKSEIDETGEYDLDGLFVRLGHAIDTLGAKRVVLDTLEVLFSGLENAAVLRAELRRLFRWLKAKGVTVVVTGERGDGTLTRHGLEEYVSDCVISLDHRIDQQVSTRRLRVVKYRGSAHDTNEFPFLIHDTGLSVVPITSAGMDHPASTERVPTGVPALDGMLGGKGYMRGTSVLISGTAGTGKTSLAGYFAAAACDRGERCLYFSFEEAQGQLVRNLRSIGLDLQRGIDAGLLRVHSTRPTRYGLEMHLATMYKLVTDFDPRVVVIDPISNFITAGTTSEAGAMLVRLVDFLKARGVTGLFSNLTHAGSPIETDVGISSIIDTWLLLRETEAGGARGGVLSVLKSRGMAHSREVRPFRLTDHGVELGGATTKEGGS